MTSIRKHGTRVKTWRRYLDKIEPENYRATGFLRAVDRWAHARMHGNMIIDELRRR